MTVFRVSLNSYDYHDCNSRWETWEEIQHWLVEDRPVALYSFVMKMNRELLDKKVAEYQKRIDDLERERDQRLAKNRLLETMSERERTVLGVEPHPQRAFDALESGIETATTKIAELQPLYNVDLSNPEGFELVGTRWTMEEEPIMTIDNLKKEIE